MNTVVGAGILALPFCFKEIGAILTLVLLPSLGIVAMCTMYLLSIVSEMTNKMAAESVGEFLLGKTGRVMTELSIMGASFGGLTAYLVVMGDILCPFMREITTNPFLSSRFFVTLVPFVLFVVPLTLVKDFRALRFSSAASIVCVMIFMGVIVYEFTHHVADHGIRHSVVENRFTWSGFIMALPVFSYVSHQNNNIVLYLLQI
jgi:amino acid permease